MGIHINPEQARQVLAQAVEWARSERSVPQEWVEVTQRMDVAPYKTYTPALGTALLARAVNSTVDALALKESYAPDAYSARGLCHGVLVPAAIEYGFTIRNTGREPLNNQPFFRYDHMTEIDRVMPRAVTSLHDLREALTKLNTQSAEAALAGLAGFLRVRFDAANTMVAELPFVDVPLDRLIEALELFLDASVDRPACTQAVAAAAFDLIFNGVRNRRINDPSRDLPGDVHAFTAGMPIMAAEVRAKRVLPTEVRAFVAATRRSAISRAFIIAIHPTHVALERLELVRWAWAEHNVVLTVIESSNELLLAVLAWSTRPVDQALGEFPGLALDRLREIEVSPRSLAAWTDLLDAIDPES